MILRLYWVENIVKERFDLYWAFSGATWWITPEWITWCRGDLEGWNIASFNLKLRDLLQGLVSGFTLFDLELVIPRVSGFPLCRGPLLLVLWTNCLLRILGCDIGYCVLIYLNESRATDMVLERDLKDWNMTQVNWNSDDGCRLLVPGIITISHRRGSIDLGVQDSEIVILEVPGDSPKWACPQIVCWECYDGRT